MNIWKYFTNRHFPVIGAQQYLLNERVMYNLFELAYVAESLL